MSEDLETSESLQIRQIIILTSKRLMNHYSDLKTTDLNIVIDNSITKEQKIIRLKDLIYMTSNFIKKIITCIETLVNKNEDWTQLRKTMVGEEKKEELTIYGKFVAKNNFLEMIGEAQDIVHNLETKVEELNDSIKTINGNLVPVRTNN